MNGTDRHQSGDVDKSMDRADALTAAATSSRDHVTKATVAPPTSVDLTPLRAAAQTAEASDGALVDRVSLLIEQSRAVVVVQANAVLTLRNWYIGQMIHVEVLGERRAAYGSKIVATLSHQLTSRFGAGFDRTSLNRMVKFSQMFAEDEIGATLSHQLSWSHFKVLLRVERPEARAFYIEQAVTAHLGVRALDELIGRQGYERKEIANAQAPDGSTVPVDSFRDPYLLDFLGLKSAYVERDLEEAIVRDLETFLLEAGNGWAFVARQKRMSIEHDDFYLDLLFYSRPLRRLIAVELKIGKFRASYKGQMNLYLKWLNRYERRDGEETPIGLILCTEASREQIELLEMHNDGIVVAEYWTALPPKAELQARIQEIYQAASERVARRKLAAEEHSGD